MMTLCVGAPVESATRPRGLGDRVHTVDIECRSPRPHHPRRRSGAAVTRLASRRHARMALPKVTPRTSPADHQLLARLAAGDEAAFDEIFRTWYAALVRFAERLIGDRANAEEVVQDVLLSLWRQRELLRGHGSAQAWLFRATRIGQKAVEARPPPATRSVTTLSGGVTRIARAKRADICTVSSRDVMVPPTVAVQRPGVPTGSAMVSLAGAVRNVHRAPDARSTDAPRTIPPAPLRQARHIARRLRSRLRAQYGRAPHTAPRTGADDTVLSPPRSSPATEPPSRSPKMPA